MKNISIYNTSKSIIRDLEKEIEQIFCNTGIYFRLFSRIKQSKSITEKIEKKRLEHENNSYKIQDYIGFRIVVYFRDDIQICDDILNRKYSIINKSIDKLESDKFAPKRTNYVVKLPEIHQHIIPHDLQDTVDFTFEIQLRTIFSEGWHEVEHDLRYKCKEDWENYKEEERILNGVLATLENCDWAISKLFDDLSYSNYKNKEWEKMIKNKFRVHIASSNLDKKIITILNDNNDTAKAIFRTNRIEILKLMAEHTLPFSYDNLIYTTLLHEKIECNIAIPEVIRKLSPS